MYFAHCLVLWRDLLATMESPVPEAKYKMHNVALPIATLRRGVQFPLRFLLPIQFTLFMTFFISLPSQTKIMKITTCFDVEARHDRNKLLTDVPLLVTQRIEKKQRR